MQTSLFFKLEDLSLPLVHSSLYNLIKNTKWKHEDIPLPAQMQSKVITTIKKKKNTM